MASQTKIPCQEPQDQLLTTVTRTGTDTARQVHSPIPVDTTATVVMLPTEAIPGHIIETIGIIIGVLHNALTPVLIVPAVTPHITDHLHTGAHQLTLRTVADHDPIQHTKPSKKTLHKFSSCPSSTQAK